MVIKKGWRLLFGNINYLLLLCGMMNVTTEILENAINEIKLLTPEERREIELEASESMNRYIMGDGDSRDLYNYYDCMEKLK
jgi:hypothetical protein